MLVTCPTCELEYDDFDHWTFCPHARFGLSPHVRAMQEHGELRKDSGREGDPHPPRYPRLVR